MMVFGEKTLYVSHLPMFDKLNARKDAYVTPHRFQVILDATLSARAGNPQQTYFDDRQTHPQVRMYTLQPEPFVLATLFPAATGPAQASEFPVAAVFRGHLERQGRVKILTGGTISVRKVLYAHPFNAAEKRPAQLEYLLFGKGDELFACHLIAAPPDFDQIVPVRVEAGTFQAEELARGIRISIPGSKNAAATRVNSQAGISAQTVAAAPRSFQLDAGRELYFEEGELSIPPQFEQTTEEKRAGFTEEMA